MDAAGGRGRGRQGGGRGLAPRGRARGARGRGRAQGHPDFLADGVSADGAIQVAGGVNADGAIHVLNLDVPNQLLNQSEQIDSTNRELSILYKDMRDVRAAISEMRQLVVPNQAAYNKLIEEQINGYQEMRRTGQGLRNKIRKMAGVPFDEPRGFDVMP